MFENIRTFSKLRYKKRDQKSSPLLGRNFPGFWRRKLSKWEPFIIKIVDFFCTKSGPGSKSRNLEQTLAWRIRTKGPDPSKRILFRAGGRQKGDHKRRREEGRKKGGKGEAKGAKREPKRSQNVVKKGHKNEGGKREVKSTKKGPPAARPGGMREAGFGVPVHPLYSSQVQT